MTCTTMTDREITPVTGAWYIAKDLQEIRRVFGDRATEYLRIPRRASFVIKDHARPGCVQFSTIGDSTPAIGMNGKEVLRPVWDIHWLKMVKNPCQVQGQVFKVYPGWRQESDRRSRTAKSHYTRWFRPDYADKEVTATHESYSGISLWVRGPDGGMACIPREYLCPVKDKKKLVVDEELVEELTEMGVLPKVDYGLDHQSSGCRTCNGRGRYIDKWGSVEAKWVSCHNCQGTGTNDQKQGEVKVSDKKLNIIDEKVRIMDSKLRDLEHRLPEDCMEDTENDLEHSMVLDLPPEIAEWAKDAGIGLEDMIPLAEKICALQSEMNREIQKTLSEAEVDLEVEAQETQRIDVQYKLKACISSYRHETLQTLIKWGAGAGSISYLAHQVSGLFI